MHRAWVEVDLGAVRHNLRQLQRLIEPARLLAVVKSEAYGHGMVPVARVAVEEGCWGLAVVTVEEGLRLRAEGLRCPVVVVGPVFRFEMAAALEHEIALPVYGYEEAEELAAVARETGRTAKIHVKFDTGLGRLAVRSEHARDFLTYLLGLKELRIEGIYSHYADAEGLDQKYTLEQFARFREVLAIAQELGIQDAVRHISASAAGMLIEGARFDLVRVGISMYGLWPAEETRILVASRGGDLFEQLNTRFSSGETMALDSFLRPALSYKTWVAQVKELPAGSLVGYGCTVQLSRQSRVAVLPVGYAEGYDRHLSNQGNVLIRGQRARVLGRVCMNMTTVDVTDIPEAVAGDEAVLIGAQGESRIHAEELAKKIGTINYEVVTRIPTQIPRVYLQ